MCSRGVDIRGVDWVVNFDCPEDAKAYLHRVGRTARNRAGGSALLFLLPSEALMAERLAAAKIPLLCGAESFPKKVVSGENSRKTAFLEENSENTDYSGKNGKKPAFAGRMTKETLSEKFASFMAEDEELKYLAQKAFVCYVRGVDKSRCKDVYFNNLEFFAVFGEFGDFCFSILLRSALIYYVNFNGFCNFSIFIEIHLIFSYNYTIFLSL